MRGLPAEVTGFVGRERELASLTSLLSSARLVTVTGPGGVGKTRVALRCAGQVADRYADGVCLVELSALRDPELLPHAVANSLGLPEQDGRSQLDAVLDYLRERQLLLVLDTCEHLIDSCAMLAEVLLRTAAEVSVLATSRQPMDVPGEHTYPVPPLPVPDDAVRLFAQRAAEVVPGFVVDDSNLDTVVALCRRLDGLPLALELATVRLRALSLSQLADRLEDRFRLLTGGRRATLPHHQTLRTATEWSYDLCKPAEQVLWARLSVFAGSFDLTAAQEVCADQALTPADVVDALIGLVDKSVVLRAGPGTNDRYRLLDTIREFGAAKLAGSGAEAGLRDRHIARYTGLARYFGRHTQGNDQLPRYRQLLAEHADLRAAIDYALALPGHDTDAATITSSLSGFWQMSGKVREGRYWLTKVMERFPGPSAERARALVVHGSLAIFQGRAREAAALTEQGVAMAEEVGDDVTAALGYMFWCLALTTVGRYDEALTAGAIAEQRATATGDQAALVWLDYEMCYLYLLTGRLDDGLARCEQGLARLGEGSEELWIRSFLHALRGLALFLRGDYPGSEEAMLLGLTMKHQIGDKPGMGYALEGAALLAATRHRYTRAAWLLGAAAEIWQLVGSRLGGDGFLEALHQQTEQAATESLGSERFGVLFRRGAQATLDQVVAAAAGGAEELPFLAADPAGSALADPLTAREREVALLVPEGLSNREIAERLVISKRTVDAHIEHIYDKLGISTRVQLVGWLNSG